MRKGIEAAKFTTVALLPGQYLRKRFAPFISSGEAFCIGYENGKRAKELDGYYYTADLIQININTPIKKTA